MEQIKIIFDSSDRWRKKVENHILMSYFTKQAGYFFGGADLIPGSGDIPDLCVEVELFANNFTVIRWIPKDLIGKSNKMEVFYLGPVSVEEIHFKEENHDSNREESGSERQAVSQSISEERGCETQ